jgi:hypothetical protein
MAWDGVTLGSPMKLLNRLDDSGLIVFAESCVERQPNEAPAYIFSDWTLRFGGGPTPGHVREVQWKVVEYA